LAAADSLLFFSLSNWQQPTASFFSVEQISSGRRLLFFYFNEFAAADGKYFLGLGNLPEQFAC